MPMTNTRSMPSPSTPCAVSSGTAKFEEVKSALPRNAPCTAEG